jgi:hypothetical protein
MSDDTSERADDHEWLSWFYAHADFGPADGDVRIHLKQKFMRESGKRLPVGYEEPNDD